MMKKILKSGFLLFVIAMAMNGCYKSDSGSPAMDNGGSTTGKGGSMAKFSIINDHLYLINDSSLVVYSVSNAANPSQINKINVDFGIETVFALKEKLFIGSISGVYIYDISNPNNILFLSKYEHITSCDPVVANDTLAFATLNSRSTCRWNNNVNQLDVIDIRNVVYPTWLSSVPYVDAKGLGIDSTYVFVCIGAEGVQILDFSNPYQLVRVSGVLGINAYDLILKDKIMYLVGKDGLFQYDYTDIHQIELLSNILF